MKAPQLAESLAEMSFQRSLCGYIALHCPTAPLLEGFIAQLADKKESMTQQSKSEFIRDIVNARDASGYAPIHHATKPNYGSLGPEQRAEVVTTLIRFGANVVAATPAMGLTALHRLVAASLGTSTQGCEGDDEAEYLMASRLVHEGGSAQLHVKDSNGNTPYQMVVRSCSRDGEGGDSAPCGKRKRWMDLLEPHTL